MDANGGAASEERSGILAEVVGNAGEVHFITYDEGFPFFQRNALFHRKSPMEEDTASTVTEQPVAVEKIKAVYQSGFK